MSRVAMLKRKLEELRQSEAKINAEITEATLEIRYYKIEEMQHFIRVHCARVTGFRGSDTDVLIFDNGLIGHSSHEGMCLVNANVPILKYHDEKFHICDRDGESLADICKRIALIADMLPVVTFLVHDVFPDLRRVFTCLDVESLMTSRVLRWIARQVGGTQWPDIVSGNFPLK